MENISKLREILNICEIETAFVKTPAMGAISNEDFQILKYYLVNCLHGKWSRERQGYQFNFPIYSLVKELIHNGNFIDLRNYQLFPTDVNLIGSLFHFAYESGIDLDSKLNGELLEPNVGGGNMVKVANVKGFKNISFCEICEPYKKVAELEFNRLNIKANFIQPDFLTLANEYNKAFDVVLANPPFNKQTKHIKKMTEVLKPNGVLMCISSSTLYDDVKFEEFMDKNFSNWQMNKLICDKEDKETWFFENTGVNICLIVGQKRVD